MSQITCNQFTAQVHELVDGRLADDVAGSLKTHASQCESCARLLASDQQLVDSLGSLQGPATPPHTEQQLAQALLTWEQQYRRARSWRWAANAALLLMGVTAGLALALTRPPQAPQPQATPHVVRVIRDNEQKHLSQQLARHVRSTEGLYQQVLQLKNDKLARALLDAELKLSRLKQSTPDLQRSVGHTPNSSTELLAYLTETNEMVELIHHWLHHEKLSLKEIQQKLRQSKLPTQIAQLKQQLTPIETLPEGLPDDPALLLYLRARQHLHLGQPGWAVTYMQQFAERFPRHELSRGWKQAMPEHAHVHPEDDPDQPPPALVDEDIRGILGLDNDFFDLETSAKPIKQFYKLWRLASKQGFLLGAGVHRYKADDGQLYRELELTWHTKTRTDKQMIVAMNKLLQICGLHRHDPNAFPREVSLIALDKDFPRQTFPID